METNTVTPAELVKPRTSVAIGVSHPGSRDRLQMVPKVAPRCMKTNLQLVWSQSLRHVSQLAAEYAKKKRECEESGGLQPVDPLSVFANSEVDLAEIDAYGFDFDYTVAQYSTELHRAIYEKAKQLLVEHKLFPQGILDIQYDPHFAIRGLHHDKEKNLLMKLDNFLRIEPWTVYRGRTPVLNEEIRNLYGSNQVSIVDLNIFSEKSKNARIRQFLDMFALPEMTLLCDCTQYLMDQEIPFDHEYLASDVEFVIRKLHTSHAIHEEILSDKERYITRNDGIGKYFNRLKEARKKLFIVTNSKFSFVDQGMRHITGDDWRDLFDVVVVRARKPTFFTDANRPFRSQHPNCDTPTWRKIMKFEHGGVYQEGNVDQLMKLTGWHGANVLYFGDHVYTDLADPVMKNGWRTGAIIPELEGEIEISSSLEYQRTRRWWLTLEKLIEQLQYESNGEMSDRLHSWLQEKAELRKKLKVTFNPHFGSIFRTHQNPTYFSWHLARFADIYTSSLENLNRYSLKHRFYPHRAALPHELHVGLD